MHYKPALVFQAVFQTWQKSFGDHNRLFSVSMGKNGLLENDRVL